MMMFTSTLACCRPATAPRRCGTGAASTLGAGGGALVWCGEGGVGGGVGRERGGELGVVEGDVPVAVVVAGGVGVGGGGDRVDVGLVGVVPVPAGQPDALMVLDGDFDVVGVG